MTNDIKALIDYYEREKGLSREKILLALESAFLSAYRKMVPGSGSINYLRAEINVDKGKVRIFADLEVVPDEEYKDKFNQIPLSLAVKLDQNAVLHDLLATNITPKGFGRIAVQTARQTMLQKLLDAEKEMLYDEFKDRAGDLVTGTIRRFEKGDIFVDLGKFEGVMTSRERVPNEDYSVGDRMRFYVVEVRTEGRGPEVILSRSHPNLVRRLFESEVVEIGDQTVEIHGIAREAGYRTKVAVISHDDKVDPVGACVGPALKTLSGNSTMKRWTSWNGRKTPSNSSGRPSAPWSPGKSPWTKTPRESSSSSRTTRTSPRPSAAGARTPASPPA